MISRIFHLLLKIKLTWEIVLRAICGSIPGYLCVEYITGYESATFLWPGTYMLSDTTMHSDKSSGLPISHQMSTLYLPSDDAHAVATDLKYYEGIFKKIKNIHVSQ